MALLRARYAKIERLASAVLAEAGVVKPAVPIGEIVFAKGIEILRGDLDDVSGLIMRDRNRTVIGINGSHNPKRQRFTLAHEFGHFLLHHSISSHRDTSFRVRYRDRVSSEASDIHEIEANFFAACILMPRDFLDSIGAAEALDDDEEVETLASTFNVSRHAMSLRLVNVYSRNSPY